MFGDLQDLNFNANEVEVDDFSALAPGEYPVVFTDNEKRTNKSGEGAHLYLVAEVIGEKAKGRKLFERLNLWNKNPDAVSIAKQSLAKICKAIDVPVPKNSDELRNKPLVAVVGQYEYNGQTRNEITDYRPYSSVAQSAPTTAPAPSSGATAPWLK